MAVATPRRLVMVSAIEGNLCGMYICVSSLKIAYPETTATVTYKLFLFLFALLKYQAQTHEKPKNRGK